MAVSYIIASVMIDTTPLASDFNDITLHITSSTTYTENETYFCKINTLKKDYRVYFKIDNDISELLEYFENLTVTIRIGGSQTVTEFDGTKVTQGYIELTDDVSSYDAYITVAYTTTDKTGDVELKIAIWAEGIE